MKVQVRKPPQSGSRHVLVVMVQLTPFKQEQNARTRLYFDEQDADVLVNHGLNVETIQNEMQHLEQ